MSQQWDQLKDLLNIQERMNRLFDDAINHPNPAAAEKEASAGVWTPMVDVFETEQEFVIKADLTEVPSEDIQINIEDSKLVISGERRLPAELKPEQFHCNERHYGRFARVFTLPQNIDEEKVRADYKDGLLI